MGVTEKNLGSIDDKTKLYTGLSEKEARRKYDKHGPNIIIGKKKKSAMKILFTQFGDFMVLILIASTLISAFMGEVMEAITIIAIVIINAILGFIQEYRTERTMEAIKDLAAPSAKVIREGGQTSIPAEQVVPGDLIVLEAGDRVPADAVLTRINNLQIDESLLTGESVPVEKVLDVYNGKNPNSEIKKSSVYMGTIVASGRGTGIVYTTGMSTEMGKIADMLQNIEEGGTPLQKKLDRLGKNIVYGCLVICAIVTLAGIMRGESVFVMLLAGISLAVAAVPEGLPAIVTIALALGVQRMLRKNALVRKLPAVETLGCASIICSDKTGTLTENRMTVRKIYADGKMVDVKGTGYSPEGDFLFDNKRINPLQFSTMKLALEIGGLCNNARLTINDNEKKRPLIKIKSLLKNEEKWQIIGDPTEGALLVAAAKAGLTCDVLDKSYFRVGEFPFDSERKCMSVICNNKKGETYVFTKGAPDIIVEKCSRVHIAGGITEITGFIKAGLMKINDYMAEDALRVLGVAYKKLDFEVPTYKNIEKDLVFVGLTGMNDPPRKEAADAVRKCKMAGIKPVMITGDHKITAAAIAKELNILSDGNMVLTGAELDEMGMMKFERVAKDVSVFARVSPKHKLMIVKALKKHGHIVAMTGDGVNDAPAVKEADIGVSMGITGTDVTKEASSMILMDDNFVTVVAAIEEGRVIYSNIRKFIRYMLSCNLGEVLTMFLGMMVGLPLPLLPIQILWVNLVTDGLPAVALGFDPPDKDIMMRLPRSKRENIFSKGLLNLIIFRGTLIGLCTLAVFASILFLTNDVGRARTGAFITLVITQLIHVFECKSERKNIFEIPVLNNIMLVLSVLLSLILVLGVIYIPFFQSIFKTVYLFFNDWILITGFSVLGPTVASIFKIRGK